MKLRSSPHIRHVISSLLFLLVVLTFFARYVLILGGCGRQPSLETP